ncbi:MAG: hypothetical protein JWR44_1213 [Hymenobacter sp.]|jgi:hypothetical protein|nr:hypothetical protein [Hymenobacter sp.]
MKVFLFLLLLTLAACSKDAAPVAPRAPAVTYTDPAGKQTALTAYSVSLTTPPPSTTGQPRQILVFRATLPDGSVLELLYYYLGNGFPAATGAVRLDEFVQSANYPMGGNANGGTYFGGTATGTLSVDSVSPAVCSGTFAGPMVQGGPGVRLVFERVRL